MCYTVKQLQDRVERKALRDRLMNHGSQTAISFHAVNAFVHPGLRVITGEDGGTLRTMQWGLIPSWCRDRRQATEISDMTPNARSETIFDKPSFRSVSSRRCILPVDGFYEWRDYQGKKYPYYIFPAQGETFSLGCIWDSWVDKETGEIRDTFSIVTTAANPVMNQIHNSKKRMPLILPEASEKEWLDTLTGKEDLQNMMKPCPHHMLQFHSVSRRITSRTENPNVPEVSEPFIYPELPAVTV
ncbi:MAG: SOS response-associated peptidase [Bacteroidia bacterium]|nr:SOS response-associated peptidase [Bacteroidia bacterium]